jgi:hypothetical protein
VFDVCLLMVGWNSPYTIMICFLMTGKPNLVAFPLPPAAAKYFDHVHESISSVILWVWWCDPLKIHCLPKVWERAREPYGKRRFSRRSQKSNFRRITMNFFLVVAIMSSMKLMFFFIFPIKGRVIFSSSPKFGNAP